MAKQVVSGRVPVDLATWVDAYAEQRGVARGAVIQAALEGLRDDTRRGVPELPQSDPVPSPEQTGTEHWREPTEEELSSVRDRYQDLSPQQWHRLARAEARMADMGLPTAPAHPMPDEPADLAKNIPRQGGDFSRLTHARGEFFAELHTPESISGKVSAKKAYGGGS